MADYQVILHTPFGVPLDDLSSFISLEMVRDVNDVGKLVLYLSSDFDDVLFSGNDVIVDNRIEVRRRIGAGGYYLEGETQWLVIDGKKEISPDGVRSTKIICEDAVGLLARRIVAYNSGTAQSSKAPTFTEVTMKDIVDENFASAATDANRNLNSTNTLLTIESDLNIGASVGKSFARRNVLEVLQELADSSAKAGTYLAFDIVSPSPTQLEFRVYSGQRGIDRRFPSGSNPVLLSSELGNLSGASIEYDHSKEINYAYAGGQGTGASRNVQVASDTTRIAVSPFNRREVFVDARQVASGDANENAKLVNEADAAVRSGLVKRPFQAQLTENDTTIYGLNVGFGDYVTAVFDGNRIDCRLNTVKISIKNKKEIVEAKLQGEVA